MVACIFSGIRDNEETVHGVSATAFREGRMKKIQLLTKNNEGRDKRQAREKRPKMK
jgi:hypothetical protein